MDNLGVTDIREQTAEIAGWAEDLEKLLDELDVDFAGVISKIEDIAYHTTSEWVQDSLFEVVAEIQRIGEKLDKI